MNDRKEKLHKAYRNEFIRRCFRDQADTDYISARVNWRLGLSDQFYWAGLQANEKYLKAILLFHEQDTRSLSHDLIKALASVEQIEGISWDFNDNLREWLKKLYFYGSNRYFEFPKATFRKELFWLDEGVWAIRRYCQDLSGYKERGTFDAHIRFLQSEACLRNPLAFRLALNGYLEQVLDRGRFRKQREVLVWKNFYYGKRRKKKIRITTSRGSANPAHYGYPDIWPWVKKRVRLSRKFIVFFEKKRSPKR